MLTRQGSNPASVSYLSHITSIVIINLACSFQHKMQLIVWYNFKATSTSTRGSIGLYCSSAAKVVKSLYNRVDSKLLTGSSYIKEAANGCHEILWCPMDHTGDGRRESGWYLGEGSLNQESADMTPRARLKIFPIWWKNEILLLKSESHLCRL